MVVRSGTMYVEDVVRYCDSLQRKLREEVGHINAAGLCRYAERDLIFLAFDNGDPVGYVLFNDEGRSLARCRVLRPRTTRIYQACVQYDARFVEHGRRLVEEVESRSLERGKQRVDCFVTSTIAANAFWVAMGFVAVGWRPGGPNRRRILTHYRKEIRSGVVDPVSGACHSCQLLLPGFEGAIGHWS